MDSLDTANRTIKLEPEDYADNNFDSVTDDSSDGSECEDDKCQKNDVVK